MHVNVEIPEESLKYIERIVLNVEGEDIVPRLIVKNGFSVPYNKLETKVVARIY